MAKIISIQAREVLDSRGNPTVEVEIVSEAGRGRAIVPSGASTGEHEACELRDGDAHRFLGKGVLKAVENVNEIIAPALVGMDVRDQEAIDKTMIKLDDSENKSNLGANAILAVSMASARTAANGNNMDLWEYLNPKASMMPMPMINVINGGAHANSSVDFQEFMLVPNGAHHFREAVQMSAEVFHHLKKFLKNNGHITEVGDEGGFAPNFKTNKEPLYAMEHAIKEAGYRLGQDFVFALDPATSELYNSSSYEFPRSGEVRRSSDDMIQLWTEWCDEFPIVSIEDGLAENDWEGWKKLVNQLGDRVQLVGDDLLVTNSKFIKRAIDEKAANALLVKVNQIGTLTEAHEAVKLAQKNGFRTVMSHRSGETEDTSIADLAVAWGCGQIKTGSMSRTDRIAKYNQLLRIADKLGDEATLFHF